jgi:hypothetical protein
MLSFGLCSKLPTRVSIFKTHREMTTFSFHKPLSCKTQNPRPFLSQHFVIILTHNSQMFNKNQNLKHKNICFQTCKNPDLPTLWINILFKFFSKKSMCWPIWGFQVDPCSDLVFKIIYNGFKWNKFHHNTYPRSRLQDPNWTQHGKSQGQLNLSL